MATKKTQATKTVSAIAHMADQATGKAKKPVSKTASRKVTPLAPKKIFQYGIITGRPTVGAKLWAFTQAWMELAGLMDGKSVERADAVAVAGTTAINFHLKEGRFAEDEGRIRVTAGGLIHFKARASKVSRADVQTWQDILTTGKPDGRLIAVAEQLRKLDA